MAQELIIKEGLIVEGDGTNEVVLEILGTLGSLFSVKDSFTGVLHSISDGSGTPIFKVEDTGVSTFNGIVKGVDPVADEDLVTKGWAEANLSGGGGVGTVTSIATSGSISGGTITTTGTITHLTTAGHKHIPTGGAANQILQYSASGTAVWYTPPWTTNTGDITGVTAGTGLSGGATSGTATLNIVSAAGTAGSIGTINVGATTLGVNLGTTSTTAAAGNHTHTNYITSNASDTATGIYTFTNATAATSFATGALRISGGIGVALNSYFGGQIYMENGKYIYIKDSSSNDTRIIGMATNDNIYMGHVDNVNAGSVIIRTEGTDRLTINSAGSTTFSGNVNAPGYYETSDRSLKENIIPLDDRYYAFNFIGDERQRYGVIAQEIEKTHSELVVEQDDKTLAVNYIDLLCLEIVELKERIQALEDGERK